MECCPPPALAFDQGAGPPLQVFGYATPILSAALAFLGVRQTLRQKQVTDDRAHWWDQTKWAFNVAVDPRSDADDLRMALDTLVEQISVNEVDGADLRRVVAMATKARSRLRLLGITPSRQYTHR